MKKIMKSMLVFVLVAVMMCGVMVTAQAASGEQVTPVDPTDPNHGGGGSGGHQHDWMFLRFDWEEDHKNKKCTAYAVYECQDVDCMEERSIIASVTRSSGDVYTATIVAEKSLDGQRHSEEYTLHHLWAFEGFEWFIEQEFSWSDRVLTAVKAKYRCLACNRLVLVDATVTGTYVVTAHVDCEEALDDEEHSETIELNHEWVFNGFTWDYDTITATADYTCKNCGEKCSIDADMSYINVCQAKAYVDQYKSKDRQAHSEIKEVDYHGYDPYGVDYSHIYEFIGFRWEKITNTRYKAFAQYKKGVMGGGVLYWLDVVEIEAHVSTKQNTLAYRVLEARVEHWQTPDNIMRTETKEVSTRPDIGPVVPINPREKISDPIVVVGPPKDLNPVNP